jgi:pentatricopeptide repeat protein
MKSYAALLDMDQVEEVLNEIDRDDNIDANWTVYGTRVDIYIKAKVLDKAQSALKEMESKMKEMEAKKKQKEQAAYDYLISLHGNLGNKDEIYRIWQSFELTLPETTHRSHICLLSTLVRIGDIEGAEDFLKKWESVKSFEDIRASNILLDAYIKRGWLQKAEVFLERIRENGSKPNSISWKILAEGYLQDGQYDKATEAMEKSVSVGRNIPWQSMAAIVLAILKHFEKEGDVKNAEKFFKVLRGVKFVSTGIYNSLIRTYVHVGKVPPRISEHMKEDNVSPDEETNILLKQSDDG